MAVSIPEPVEFLDLGLFDQVSSDRFNLVSSGGAFQNPVNELINQVTSLSGTARSEIAAMVVPPSGFTPTDITDITSKIDALQTSNDELLAHTNLLSGVDLSTGQATANIRSLLSVGSGSIALDHTLNQAVNNPCGKLLTLFGSLFLSQDQLKEMAQYFQDIVGTINNGQATADQIKGQLDAYKTQLETLIANDRNYYNNAMNDLVHASLSQMLGSAANDPCARYLLTKSIGTDNLVNLI